MAYIKIHWIECKFLHKYDGNDDGFIINKGFNNTNQTFQ